VVWCGVVWCGVVWCGVVWCGVVWCGVVWCGVVRGGKRVIVFHLRVSRVFFFALNNTRPCVVREGVWVNFYFPGCTCLALEACEACCTDSILSVRCTSTSREVASLHDAPIAISTVPV
jgi:hypothetical protein